MKDKFKRKNGRLTAYALACGYLESHKVGDDAQAVTMGAEGAVYFVKQRIHDDKPAWETFPHTAQGYRDALALFLSHCADRWNIELTDTFGGEANYAWVRRATFTTPQGASRRVIVREAKRALDLCGRWNTTDLGEGYELRTRGACLVAFAVPA